ncbi:helix-turn-helix transcriptional regulator [Sulfitobacter mediterraneus]|uniref:ArsR/SmtB family transcription factor n=1 Tax=Sulfitobacter mediterraneus TaxID=83219 RepID=UPI001933326E|nr:metalloregulator ArsR/SmtB family transcription factor [Sulfitobacter mediterraneus]MBM1309025.1 helix-turn-helix transcriptional regulator [Sulfitobacter mediterraneus]MBM1312909.1 helix-turn-helix transcriptional regulator [Sulfitobacter mediterraneus]MBM1321292.1 helix-turn-helix transcriptional regulator [Sulfitobacter mediterraneus]MBM1325179.1 helix-turn-helix transcriptional regulator [Sulfitobacter mediterraneus]MBM1396526.1 helix-turn-helix transcriptional regulator [Sulfitobacter 
MSETLSSGLEEKADHVAGQLALLANPRRLLILCKLAEGECSVGALHKTLDLGQSALSQHLAKLRAGGVVDTRRQGQTIFYRIADPKMQALMGTLYDVYCRED